jgi:hypothetical protein
LALAAGDEAAIGDQLGGIEDLVGEFDELFAGVEVGGVDAD